MCYSWLSSRRFSKNVAFVTIPETRSGNSTALASRRARFARTAASSASSHSSPNPHPRTSSERTKGNAGSFADVPKGFETDRSYDDDAGPAPEPDYERNASGSAGDWSYPSPASAFAN